MNYYSRHIGDYAKKAGHLSVLEHGVYTLLLDAYYDTEQAPTKQEAIRKARVKTSEELAALDAVLSDFFTEIDGRFVQSRVEEEFVKAAQQAEVNKANGKKGGRPRKDKGKKNAKPKETDPQPKKTQPVILENRNESEKNPNPIIQESNNLKDTAPKSGAISLATFLEQCASKGEQAIPSDDPVYAYAASIGLPDGYIALAWAWFKVARADKRQKGARGWRQHFRNAVEGNWPKYWYADDAGGWALTTAGKMAERAQA